MICETCEDSHRVLARHGGLVLCGQCPLPCPKCREVTPAGLGPYCSETPCWCACHATDRRYVGLRNEARKARGTALAGAELYPVMRQFGTGTGDFVTIGVTVPASQWDAAMEELRALVGVRPDRG